MMSSYHLSEDSAAGYIEALQRFSPRIVHAYPSSIAFLANWLDAHSSRYAGDGLRGIHHLLRDARAGAEAPDRERLRLSRLRLVRPVRARCRHRHLRARQPACAVRLFDGRAAALRRGSARDRRHRLQQRGHAAHPLPHRGLRRHRPAGERLRLRARVPGRATPRRAPGHLPHAARRPQDRPASSHLQERARPRRVADLPASPTACNCGSCRHPPSTTPRKRVCWRARAIAGSGVRIEVERLDHILRTATGKFLAVVSDV